MYDDEVKNGHHDVDLVHRLFAIDIVTLVMKSKIEEYQKKNRILYLITTEEKKLKKAVGE
jgi:hypothetical protein